MNLTCYYIQLYSTALSYYIQLQCYYKVLKQERCGPKQLYENGPT